MALQTLRQTSRSRALVRVAGPEAASYLQRMLTNDVEALVVGDSCDALLLTAKARVIAPMIVFRQSSDTYVLLTEPDLGERLHRELARTKFAAKATIELEHAETTLVLGASAPPGAVENRDYGVPAHELLDAKAPAATPIGQDELELLRILAGTPRAGRELDDRILPAEAGLEQRSISFTKGCYPGQEPVARLHHRGHANRGLRILQLEADELPSYDAPVAYGSATVGRITSAVRNPAGGVAALGYIRREVPADAILSVAGRTTRQIVEQRSAP
jgi:tRNA-modifying protein YgfZ